MRRSLFYGVCLSITAVTLLFVEESVRRYHETISVCASVVTERRVVNNVACWWKCWPHETLTFLRATASVSAVAIGPELVRDWFPPAMAGLLAVDVLGSLAAVVGARCQTRKEVVTDGPTVAVSP